MMSVIIVFTWTENYGDTTVGNAQSYKNAFSAILGGKQKHKFSFSSKYPIHMYGVQKNII